MYVQIMEQQINSVEQKQQNCQMRFLRKWSFTQDDVNRTFHNVFLHNETLSSHMVLKS